MYTQVGMKGLSWRDGIDVDPVLNRNRAWHAVTHQGGTLYRALCGKVLDAVPVEESAWGARVLAKDERRVTCKTCQRKLGMRPPARRRQAVPQDVPRSAPESRYPTRVYPCYSAQLHFHRTEEERNRCLHYGPLISTNDGGSDE